MTVRTWTGGAALNDKWSDKDNWVGDKKPEFGDEVVFPAGIGALDRGTNNDISNLTLKSITFAASDFKINGNPIKLTGDITTLNATGINEISADITFLSAPHTLNAKGQLTLSGSLKNLSGVGSMTKSGGGVVLFAGSTANTLSQPLSVEDGQLVFAKSNGAAGYVGTTLTIGSTLVDKQPKVRIVQDNALTNSPSVAINTFRGGDINEIQSELVVTQGRQLRIGSLSLNSGLISGGGRVQLAGTVTVGAGNGPGQPSLIDVSEINLGSTARIFAIQDDSALIVKSAIRESADFGLPGQGIRKTGLGSIQLQPVSNHNTYKGRTNVVEGNLVIRDTVSSRIVIPGDLTVGSTSAVLATFTSLSTEVISNSSKVLIQGSGRVDLGKPEGNESFQISERIGSLEIKDSGILSNNSFQTGLLTVGEKTTVIGTGQIATTRGGSVNFIDEVRLQGGTISLGGGFATFFKDVALVAGTLEARNNGESDVPLIFKGNIRSEASSSPSRIVGTMKFDGASKRIIDVADGTAVNDFVIEGAFVQIALPVPEMHKKTGSGTLLINGDILVRSFVHIFTVSDGALLFNGSADGGFPANGSTPATSFSLNPGNGVHVDFSANGSFGSFNAGDATVSPGILGPGQFSVFRLSLSAASVLKIELNGITPITQYDQLKASLLQIVTPLSPATLDVRVGFTTALNQTFKIIEMTDPARFVEGKFMDPSANVLNEGSTFNAGGVAFRISYVGGDGNDVTLTRVSTPPAFANRSITPTINEGDFVTLSGLITEPDAEDTFFLDVNWGDGTTETFTFVPGTPRQIAVPHRYLDNGNSLTATNAYDVHISWHDAHGGSKSANLRTVVHNMAPQVSGMAFDSAPVRGQNSILRGHVYDPSPLDGIRLRINWGDGSAVETIELPLGATTFQLTHRFAKRGRHLVRVQAIDNDGGKGRDSRLWIDVVNG